MPHLMLSTPVKTRQEMQVHVKRFVESLDNKSEGVFCGTATELEVGAIIVAQLLDFMFPKVTIKLPVSISLNNEFDIVDARSVIIAKGTEKLMTEAMVEALNANHKPTQGETA